jgi:hypothetical protein
MAKAFTVIDNSWNFTLMAARLSPIATITLTGFFPIKVGSVEEMVNSLIAEADPGEIESLLVVGHGYEGAQGIGCGGSVRNDSGDKSLKFDIGETGYYELTGGAKKHLHRLRSRFEKDAVISLGGCKVAKGEEGRKLLSLISYETNTIVEASEDNQNPIMPGWEGNVLRCYHNAYWVSKSKYSLF